MQLSPLSADSPWAYLALSCWIGLACGGAAQNLAPSSADPPGVAEADALLAGASAAADDGPERAPARTSDATPAPALPTECQARGKLCLPPRDFVRRLCQGAFTGAAFHLLEKSTPFSRGYVLARKVPAVNALGGPTSDAQLEFGEEVLILTRTGDPGPGQMQVSGMGGYDVLRWDGTCANLAEGELGLHAPIKPGHAPIEWRYIDANIQEALLLDAGIQQARKAQRQQCHGVSLGTRSMACVEAESRLQDRIALAVRGGLALPPPGNLP
ncbi:MAG: hypothetical protein ABI895_00590 [Deltaproteobacteria bacterium]